MKCHAPSLFGPWSIAPADLSSMLEVVRALDLNAIRAASAAEDALRSPYRVDDGVAVLTVSGPMTPHRSSLSSVIGGTSTIETRAALRKVERDPSIKAAVIVWDTPGGTTSGTEALAAAIRRTDRAKPVLGIVADLCASAGMWGAAFCRALYASNRTAATGGIGTYATLRDTSGAMALAGIKVETISSGGVKGSGADGVPISDAYRAEVQRRVDALNAVFLSDLAAGRKLDPKRAASLGDGRVHLAAEAQALGLVDGILELDAVLALARAAADNPRPKPAPVPLAPARKPAPASNVTAFTPRPAPLPELVAYDRAIAAMTGRGLSRGIARAYVHQHQPELRAAIVQRLRMELGGPRAAELAAALMAALDPRDDGGEAA